jgi:hypothetical protein
MSRKMKMQQHLTSSWEYNKKPHLRMCALHIREMYYKLLFMSTASPGNEELWTGLDTAPVLCNPGSRLQGKSREPKACP